MESSSSGDLFAVDKRLALKPIVDFNQYLRQAFGRGSCTCIRCREAANDEADYEFAHSFKISGEPVHRRFALTSQGDVAAAFSKAWVAFTKETLPAGGIIDVETVYEFVQWDLQCHFELLIVESGVAKDVDGQLEMQPIRN